MAIVQLPKEVIEEIAAGEVVTSPAAAVKELLENSLDASPSRIRVVLSENTLDQIQIEDNGSGIEEKDLELLCTRFATSKLRTYADLEKITTHGFRGEALASISALSEVTVETSTKDSQTPGFLCSYRNTRLISKKECPVSWKSGTKITVRDLFQNDPVKRSAYARSSREHKRVAALISKYAVCYNHVRFELESEGRTRTYNAHGQTGKRESIAQIFVLSPQIGRDLLEVQITVGSHRILCFATLANTTLGSSACFISFVNRRLVELPRIKRSILSIYREVLVKGHPFVYLEINSPPEMLDVNVHPAKTEVYISGEHEILEILEAKITDELQTTKSAVLSSRPHKPNEYITGSGEKENTVSKGKHKLDRFPTAYESTLQSEHVLKSPPRLESQTQPILSLTKPHLSQPVSPAKKVRTDGSVLPLNVFLPGSPYRHKKERTTEEAANSPPHVHSRSPVFIGVVTEHWALVQRDTSLILVDLLPPFLSLIQSRVPSSGCTLELKYMTVIFESDHSNTSLNIPPDAEIVAKKYLKEAPGLVLKECEEKGLLEGTVIGTVQSLYHMFGR